MAEPKRAHSPDALVESAIVVKKQKTSGELAVVDAPKVTKDGIRRTSNLLSPIMLLTGHAGEVFTVKFNGDGSVLASGSHDKCIFLWRTYDECENYMVMKGHKNAVLDLHWTTDNERILSASPDRTVRAWDTQTGEQVKKMAEHDACVNSCCPLRRGPPLLVSGSDDGTAKLWDLRVKRSVGTYPEKYQVIAVAFGDAGDQIFTAGIENVIKVWDIRKEDVLLTLKGHSDTITGLSLSPDGTHLLSNSMDNTLRMWDVRPYAPPQRCVKFFTGLTHNFEKNLLRCAWSSDGSKVTAGSAERMVNIWDVASRRLLYKLPGHSGSVNECALHPREPIVASASSDKQIYLGELLR